MNKTLRTRLWLGIVSSLAVIGSLHAPLHAEESVATDVITAEIVQTDQILDQNVVVSRAAKAALNAATHSLNADIAIELATRLDHVKTLTASNQ